MPASSDPFCTCRQRESSKGKPAIEWGEGAGPNKQLLQPLAREETHWRSVAARHGIQIAAGNATPKPHLHPQIEQALVGVVQPSLQSRHLSAIPRSTDGRMEVRRVQLGQAGEQAGLQLQPRDDRQCTAS